MNTRSIAVAIALSAPFLAEAATIQDILSAFTGSLEAFVPVGVAIAVAAFMWGIVSFINSAGDEKAVAVGKDRMVWGIVALFFIISVWGVVNILVNMFDVGPINDDNNCSGITITEDGATTCL